VVGLFRARIELWVFFFSLLRSYNSRLILVTTMEGNTLEIVVTPEQTKVSSATLVKPDIYASNGVLHLVSSLLIPEGSLQITPEKYLLGLDCTSFVSLLHASNLTSLINETSEDITILAPPDDVLSSIRDEELPPVGSEAMARLLRYHFIPGRWTLDDLRDGMLLETSLKEAGLRNGRQVIGVEVSSSEKQGAGKVVRLGGASLMRDPSELPGLCLR
jgi:solute carrier family 25 (mitochondrial carnitine/acylcarnitine transporter), member 20/29